jgi:hypothetical protein
VGRAKIRLPWVRPSVTAAVTNACHPANHHFGTYNPETCRQHGSNFLLQAALAPSSAHQIRCTQGAVRFSVVA